MPTTMSKAINPATARTRRASPSVSAIDSSPPGSRLPRPPGDKRADVRGALERRPVAGGLETLAQVFLALFAAFAALRLRAPEQVGELGVAVALGVLDVGLEAQRVAQALLGEPDEVVVLVLRAGRVAGLLG